MINPDQALLFDYSVAGIFFVFLLRYQLFQGPWRLSNPGRVSFYFLF